MVDRLGWTLLHFLWEGAAIATALALALGLTRRESLRYGLALGTLALLAASPIATFALLGGPAPAVLSGTPRDTPGGAFVGGAPESGTPMPLLVGLWALGVGLLGLRLVGTLLHLERWRRRHARPAAPELQARFDALARRLGLRRRVALFLSDRIEVPSAWGVLRPIVVLPASLVTGLPPAQVEGILLHELAHIRRHDYLVNLLQGVVETALFYHPAVWWVSSVVRRERERLCDDVAVSALGDPMPDVRALLRLEERRQAPRPALSAREGDLMNRIARVLAPQPAPARLSPLAPSLAALAVVGLALGGALRAEAQASKPTEPTTELRSGHQQTWHRLGLDVTVDALGDALRVAAKTKDTSLVAYYRTGEGDRAWHGTGLDVTVHPSATEGGVLRLDVRSAESSVVSYYRPGTPAKAKPQALRTLPIVDVSAQIRHAQAELRVARAQRERAESVRLDAAGRIVVNDPKRAEITAANAQIAAARERLEEARRAVEQSLGDRPQASYGAPGKSHLPVWKPQDFPQGVARLAAPTKNADAQAQDWASMQRAQAELSMGLTSQRKAVLANEAAANRAAVRADYEAARARRVDPDHRAALVAQAEAAQRTAEAARQNATKDRTALLAQTATLQAQAEAAQRSAQDAARLRIESVFYDAKARTYLPADRKPLHIDVHIQPPTKADLDAAKDRDAARLETSVVYDPITRRYIVVDPKTHRVQVQAQAPANDRVTARLKALQKVGALTDAWPSPLKSANSFRALAEARIRSIRDAANAERLRTLSETQKKGLWSNESYGGLIVNGDLRLHTGTSLKGLVFAEEPKVAFENGKVSIDAKDAPFATLVRSLARKARLSVVIGKGVYADVSLVLTDHSPADALAVLCRAAGAQLRREGGVFYVSAKPGTSLEPRTYRDMVRATLLENR